jgi:hypothetical protein
VTGYFNTGAGGAVLTQLDALKAVFNGGTLKIYTDASPKDPDVAFSGTLLATFSFSATAFGADGAPAGSFPSKTVTTTASFSASTVTAAATNTAASFGLFDSSGNLRGTGSVGTSGADLNFNSVSFSSGANITISSFTLSLPE